MTPEERKLERDNIRNMECYIHNYKEAEKKILKHYATKIDMDAIMECCKHEFVEKRVNSYVCMVCDKYMGESYESEV